MVKKGGVGYEDKRDERERILQIFLNKITLWYDFDAPHNIQIISNEIMPVNLKKEFNTSSSNWFIDSDYIYVIYIISSNRISVVVDGEISLIETNFFIDLIDYIRLFWD